MSQEREPTRIGRARARRLGAQAGAAVDGGLGLTDLGNARRLVARHGKDLRYCHVWKSWLVWDGRRWARDTNGEVDRRARKTVASIYTEAGDATGSDERKALAEWAVRSESEPRLRSMVTLAASEEGIPVAPAELDADSLALTVENGTLDLRTGALRPHDPKDLITKLAPARYNPEARAPTWERFLERVLPGADLQAFVRRALGYSLTGDTSEQVLFLPHGSGANGKSTLLETLRTMLGDYARQADFSTFLAGSGDSIRNDVARLAGARFVSAVEADGSRRLSEVLIKQLTGGDTVAARFLYGEHFEYRPAFKLWLAANHKPRITGTDHAIWRRIQLIPFTVTIPEHQRDLHLRERLREEVDGILTWCVSGCLEWQTNELGVNVDVLNATEEYRQEMDRLGAFIEERCVLTPEAWVPAKDLYGAYREWCRENDEEPVSQTAFGLGLGERNFHHGRTKGVRRWRGIGLGPTIKGVPGA